MKILLLNQAFYPDPVATSQQITALAEYLVSIGYEVSVVGDSRGYNNRKQRFPKFENYRGIKIFRVFSTGLGKRNVVCRVVDAVTFLLALIFRLLRLGRYDYVVAFTSPPFLGLIAALHCKIFGGRLVQWKFDLHPSTAVAVGYLSKDGLCTRVLYRLLKFMLESSYAVVVLDRWMKEEVVRLGAKTNKVVVIPPWPLFEESAPRSINRSNPFRVRHGLEGKFVVLYSGNHSVVHPLHTLLEAALAMKDREKIVFLFNGSGVRVEEVSRFVSLHHLNNVLQLPLQPREELEYLLASANLHVVVMGENATGIVHPSKLYGVLATGKPYVFIGPQESLIAEVLAQCPYGFHVKHGEVQAMVSVIEKCQYLTEEQLSEFERANIGFLREHYSAKTLMERFVRNVLLADENFSGSGSLLVAPQENELTL